MQKTAQQRSIFNKMREGIGWDSKEYAEANQRMREADDHVRAIVSGKLEGGFSPLTNRSLKDVLKSARSHLNRREYAKSIGDLALFHKCIAESLDILKKFDDNLSKEHINFLLKSVTPDSDNYDPEYAEYLEDLRKRFTPKETGKTAHYSSDLIKDAGVIDFMSRFSDRGKELSAWEKAYPRRAKLIKNKTASMIEVSEKLLASILTNLKVMAKFRDARKIDHWYDVTKKVINALENYHKSFQAYYDSELKQLFESREFLAKPVVNPEVRPRVTPAETVPGRAPTVDELANMNPNIRGRVRPTSLDMPSNVPTIPSLFQPKPDEVAAPTKPLPNMPAPKPNPDQPNLPHVAHEKFFSSLESLSNEYPAVLAQFILKYAESIQQSDPPVYKKLIGIVKSIKV